MMPKAGRRRIRGAFDRQIVPNSSCFLLAVPLFDAPLLGVDAYAREMAGADLAGEERPRSRRPGLAHQAVGDGGESLDERALRGTFPAREPRGVWRRRGDEDLDFQVSARRVRGRKILFKPPAGSSPRRIAQAIRACASRRPSRGEPRGRPCFACTVGRFQRSVVCLFALA